MKIKILVLLILLFTCLYHIPQTLNPVSAHSVGQPPFLKINGQYANLYPVPLSSLYNFDLPQDLAPENYLLNQPINFELDTTKLPAPPDIVLKTKFDWDFTAGIHAQGIKNTHTFTKIGSYIIKIYADDGTTPKPQLLESVLLNILPNTNYELPQAKILINGKISSDPLTDILEADFANPLQFDGSKSSPANSITEFFWDFGDQNSSLGVNQTHSFPKDLSQIFVVLRVKDYNGFLADNFVEVQNSIRQLADQNQMPSTPSGQTSSQKPQVKKPNQLPFTLASIVAISILLFMARQFVLVRRRGKR